MNLKKSKLDSFSSILVIFILIFCLISIVFPVQSSKEPTNIHVLFLHGMPETPNVLMPLKDVMSDLFSSYDIDFDYWYPHLPDSESVDTWAGNVAEEISDWNPSGNIVIVGVSMGGKVAVHLTADESFGVQDRIDSVITINSPLTSFDRYCNAFFGYQYPSFLLPFMGTTVMNYSKPDGFIDVITVDSSSEAAWIASEKELLNFISGEPFPADPLFDAGFGDMFPRVLDDGTVPLPAQYINQGTVVYYGVKQHESVFRDLEEGGARDIIAETIVNFLRGDSIMQSSKIDFGSVVFNRSGPFSEDCFQKIVSIENTNDLDRDHFEIRVSNESSLFHQASVSAEWMTENSDELSLKIMVSQLRPFSKITIDWIVYGNESVSRQPYTP